MVQIPRVPDLEAQRLAMRKLGFLVGKWAGEVRLRRTPEQPITLRQTEEAQYRLDGLLLVIEAIGRSEADKQPVLQAFGIISYEDETQTYRMRAFNDGRFLETDLRLSEEGKELSWGFSLGEIRTNSTLRVNEKEEWTELTEITIGSQPPRKFMQLTVRRQR